MQEVSSGMFSGTTPGRRRGNQREQKTDPLSNDAVTIQISDDATGALCLSGIEARAYFVPPLWRSLDEVFPDNLGRGSTLSKGGTQL